MVLSVSPSQISGTFVCLVSGFVITVFNYFCREGKCDFRVSPALKERSSSLTQETRPLILPYSNRYHQGPANQINNLGNTWHKFCLKFQFCPQPSALQSSITLL